MKESELKELGFARKGGFLRLPDPDSVPAAPERVLDAVRIAVESGLEFEKAAKKALTEAAGRLADLPGERLGPSWRSLASVKHMRRAIEMLDELGGVESLLPEVSAMKGVQQPPQWHPEGDVWVHTMLTLERLGEADALLSTAALLHDVGKPSTFEIADRIRFSKHDSLGGRMARRIALRLGFDNEEAKDIEWIVRAHMKFKHVREMRPGRLKNMVLDRRFEMLGAMVRADCLASHGDTTDVDFALSARADALKENQRPEPLLRGRDLVEMGFEPGSAFGRALEELEELRRQGKVKNLAQAKNFIKNFFQNL